MIMVEYIYSNEIISHGMVVSCGFASGTNNIQFKLNLTTELISPLLESLGFASATTSTFGISSLMNCNND